MCLMQMAGNWCQIVSEFSHCHQITTCLSLIKDKSPQITCKKDHEHETQAGTCC